MRLVKATMDDAEVNICIHNQLTGCIGISQGLKEGDGLVLTFVNLGLQNGTDDEGKENLLSNNAVPFY